METIKILSFKKIDITQNEYEVVLAKPLDSQVINFDLLNSPFKGLVGYVNKDVLLFNLPQGKSFVPEHTDHSIQINKSTPYKIQMMGGLTTMEIPLSPEQEKNVYNYCVQDAPVKISMGQATPFLLPKFGFSSDNDSSKYLALCYKEDFSQNMVPSTFLDLASMQSNCYDHSCTRKENYCPCCRSERCGCPVDCPRCRCQTKETFCPGCKTTINVNLLLVFIFFVVLLISVISYIRRK